MDPKNLRRLLGEDAGALFDRRLFTIADTDVTIATLVVFALIVLATFIASAVLRRIVERALRLRGVDQEGSILATQRLVHYAVLIVGLSVGLQTIGVNLSALFAAGAVFAIGVGFAMRNLAENFVSGMILLLERSIKPDDVLEVEGQIVRVRRMGIRSTVVRGRNDEETIVPNTVLVQSNVTNYTLDDSLYRLRARVGVSYGSDMRRVREVLERTAGSLTWCSPGHPPVVLLVEFGPSSVDWEVSVWIDDPWRALVRGSQLREAIWWALQEAGITIAFPQLDVHLDAPIAVPSAP